MTKQQKPPANAEADDLNARVERELNARIDARLQAERAREREAIAAQLRREDMSREYDRINRRHPIEDKFGGLGPEGYAARLKAMAAGAKADKEWHDRVNSRPVPGSLAVTRADQKGGGSGFEIKTRRG